MESTRSDNSAKRSFNNNRNSASSNSNSNPSNKKKKTSQKTLGVAWGSNSRSSSRSSFSNSPFSNFGRFFFFFSLSLSLLQFLKIYDFMVENNWNFFMSSTVEFVTSCFCFDCDFLMVLLTIFLFF